MKTRYIFTSATFLAVTTLLVLGAACIHKREGVGPWDTNDHPSPEGGSLLQKPASLKIASGYSYTFPSGHKVTLRAISRGMDGQKENHYGIGERAWFPDGSPYIGPELRGSGRMGRAVKEGLQGVRGMSFDIQSPNREPVEVYGYIPETAKTGSEEPEFHGRDFATRIYPDFPGGTYYRIPMVVEGHEARSYRFALATGPWAQVFSTSSLPSNVADQEVAKGPWGRLRMLAPKRYRAYSGPGPAVSFVLDPADPVTMSYRVRLFEKSGVEITNGNSLVRTVAAIAVKEYAYKNLGRIEIEGRPFEYVEFQNVHFDPDPKLWGKSYWSDQGKLKVAAIPGVASLEGLLRPVRARNAWDFAELFANDGVAWRDYPEPDLLRATFSTGTWPADPLVATFKLNQKLVDDKRNITVEAYESTSPDPGKGLGAKLKASVMQKFERRIGQFLFSRPKSSYVQFKVQASTGEWTKEGEVSPPTVPLRTFSAEDKERMVAGSNPYVDVFTVILRHAGSLDFFYKTPEDPNVIKEKLVTWNADGREIRLIGRLKSGERILLYSNGVSFSPAHPSNATSHYVFRLNKTGEAELDVLNSVVLLREIVAFEVESRSYGKPGYLVAKLPPRR